MKLHEAIEKILRQTAGNALSTQQIADELNKNPWYQKKDRSAITTFQIHARTNNYPHIFYREGPIVRLVEKIDNVGTTNSTIIPLNKRNFQGIHKKSLEPISDEETTILILGSLPGDQSLRMQEYYSHSRNRFWKIISLITDSPLSLTYADKKLLLLKNRIGLWDVAKSAIREGSLDSSIKNEEPNNLDEFIELHKKLKIVAFNGLKAEAIFKKYFNKKQGIRYILLPSSSPANAVALEKICEIWARQLYNQNPQKQ